MASESPLDRASLEAAADDLEQIADYLFENAPKQAERIVQDLYDTPKRLVDFPFMGRTGRMDGTRELVLSALPYLIVYIYKHKVIHITRILHGAQKWP